MGPRLRGDDGLAVAVANLIGRPLGDGEPIAVAVSGGPDSLALLLLTRAAFGGRVRALTVDHGWRAAAADEAAAVAAHAASLGVAHVTLHWSGPKPTANRQAVARAARYRLMAEWCTTNGVAWLLTAHHHGDVAETLLLRLARGAGTSGLGGIRPRRDLGCGVTLLRPLLAATKADLATVVAAAGWTPADDPSNRDLAFDRTRARTLLAATPWLDPARLAASAAHLADAEATLAWAADLAWAGRVEVGPDAIVVDAAGLPHDLVRRLVVRAVAVLTSIPAVGRVTLTQATVASDPIFAPAPPPRGEAVERLLARLTTGHAATLAGVAARPVTRHGGPLWRFILAPPRRSVRADAPDRSGNRA